MAQQKKEAILEPTNKSREVSREVDGRFWSPTLLYSYPQQPPRTNGWIPKIMVWKSWFLLKYGHFWYLS